MKKILSTSFVVASLLFGGGAGVSAQEEVTNVQPNITDSNMYGITPYYIPTDMNMTPRIQTIKGATKTVPFRLSFGGDHGGTGYRWSLSPGTGERYQGTTTFTGITRNHTYQLSPGQMQDTYSTSASVVGVSTATISGKITHER